MPPAYRVHALHIKVPGRFIAHRRYIARQCVKRRGYGTSFSGKKEENEFSPQSALDLVRRGETTKGRTTWRREKRRRRDSSAVAHAGVATGTATYYVNIVHLLCYTQAAYAAAKTFRLHVHATLFQSNHSREQASERASGNRPSRCYEFFVDLKC